MLYRLMKEANNSRGEGRNHYVGVASQHKQEGVGNRSMDGDNRGDTVGINLQLHVDGIGREGTSVVEIHQSDIS